jgi:hypothetical protein
VNARLRRFPRRSAPIVGVDDGGADLAGDVRGCMVEDPAMEDVDSLDVIHRHQPGLAGDRVAVGVDHGHRHLAGRKQFDGHATGITIHDRSPSQQSRTLPLSTSRDHHFLPVFYLKQWVDPTTGTVIEYSKKHRKLIAKPISPKRTGFEPGLNTFPELGPLATFLEDEFLKEVDNDSATALQGLLAGNLNAVANDPKLKSAWSRFMIGMKLRHPNAIKELRAGADKIWNKGDADTQARWEAIREQHHPLKFDDYIETAEPTIKYKFMVNSIAKSIDNEIVGTRINQAQWGVLDVSKSPTRLLTSDRPVEMVNFDKPNGMASIPLSPTLLFVAAFAQQVFDRLAKVPAEQVVDQVNQFVISRARLYAYANDETQTAFIEKYMSTNMEPTPLFPTLV